MGGLPKTNNENEYIIVAGDYFSKWKEAYAISDHTALAVADKLATEFMVFQIRYIQIKGDNLRVNYFLNFVDSWVLRKQEPLLIDLSLMDL